MSLRLRSNKRPHYFTGQLLGQEDFLDEQEYQLKLQRSHARLQHTYGIVMGFEVSVVDSTTVLVKPGAALDALGRLIVLDTAQSYPIATPATSSALYLVVGYEESFDPNDHSKDDSEGFTRCTEHCVLNHSAEPPTHKEAVVVLAKLQLTNGTLTKDDSVRREAGARLAPASVVTSHLSPGSVTLAKLATELRGGWVRTPFKPSPFIDGQQVGTAVVTRDFTINTTTTTCGDRGAKGTMAIPIPILADRVLNFMIAGASNEKGLSIEVALCGWDFAKDQHEKITLLQTKMPAKSPFAETFAINKTFDRTRHGMAVFVEAAGDANISILAAQFDSSLS